jgi:hypothetical protein
LSIEAISLTPRQRAALSRCRARWTAICRSTEPAARDAAEQGVQRAYRAAGLAPPARIVWCESPRALWERARAASRTDGPNVRGDLADRLRRQVAMQVRSRVHARLLAMVQAAGPADGLVHSAAETVIQNAGREDEPLLTLVRRSYPLSWSTALAVLLGRQGFRYAAIGPHELPWLGLYDSLREMFDLEEETAALAGLWQVARSAGWMQPHRATCWLAERPNLLRGDARDRLHDPCGPALRYPDGWSVWAWRGVEVPRWIIEQPGAITLETIDAEMNVQVRRCMIEIMTPARYVALGGAARIAEDETGVLWRKIWFSTDAWAAVEVINATPEADGTRQHFFLQVPADMSTAREAVAWTYGLGTKTYANLVTRT